MAVSFILGGTLSESKSRVRINLELSNIYDENIVWSSTEEFQKDDMFSAQDKLERIVRRAIQSNLTMGESFISYYEKNFSDYEDLLEIRRLDVLTYKENVSIVKGLAQPYEKFVEKYKHFAPPQQQDVQEFLIILIDEMIESSKIEMEKSSSKLERDIFWNKFFKKSY